VAVLALVRNFGWVDLVDYWEVLVVQEDQGALVAEIVVVPFVG